MALLKPLQPVILLTPHRAGAVVAAALCRYLIFFICPTLLVFTRNTSVLLLSKAVLLLQCTCIKRNGEKPAALTASTQVLVFKDKEVSFLMLERPSVQCPLPQWQVLDALITDIHQTFFFFFSFSDSKSSSRSWGRRSGGNGIWFLSQSPTPRHVLSCNPSLRAPSRPAPGDGAKGSSEFPAWPQICTELSQR